MTRRPTVHLHRGLLGGLAIVALALLATFYSVVASAVDHAASKRTRADAGPIVQVAATIPGRASSARRPVLLAGATP